MLDFFHFYSIYLLMSNNFFAEVLKWAAQNGLGKWVKSRKPSKCLIRPNQRGIWLKMLNYECESKMPVSIRRKRSTNPGR